MKFLMKFATICCVLASVPYLSFGQYSVNVQNVNIPVKTGHQRMGNPGPAGKEIIVNNLYMTVGGQPVLPVMGEFHAERYDKRYWKDVLLKMKAGGVDIVSAYLIWIYHEEIENEINFEGNNNIRDFLDLCKEVDILVHMRIGPYSNAEARNGGIPDWMKRKEGVRVRYNDPVYLSYVRRLYGHYADQMKGYYYKDNGPIMAIQLENEYVEPNHVIPHMTTLKKMAQDCGIDAPLYSMTHWMSSDYPKNEIIPYAGYYIEMPWDASTKKLPPSNYLYFSYNRISDNIGTDLIKKSDDINTLDADEYDSPYFTCEVGLGNQVTYHRRPILDGPSGGANINLRLGCGVTLMGYYMFSGGSHPMGELTTTNAGNCSRISYDFMAPIGEFGEINDLYKESKKYNYLMNDFGSEMAEMIACLPVSNTNPDNLQWAVRVKDNSGYLFCSNYQRVWERKTYKNVQFKVKLKSETMTIPSKPITVVDKSYFAWPFNQKYGDVLLKYATAQPICKITDQGMTTYFFYEDDQIGAEYVFDKEGVESIDAGCGEVVKTSKGYTINAIKAGMGAYIDVTSKTGSKVRFVTLTAAQSDNIWRGKVGNREYVMITDQGVKFLGDAIELYGEKNSKELFVYPYIDKVSGVKGNLSAAGKEGIFAKYATNAPKQNFVVDINKINMMDQAFWIAPDKGASLDLAKIFYIHEGSAVRNSILRISSSEPVRVKVNDTYVTEKHSDGYNVFEIEKSLKTKNNELTIEVPAADTRIIASIETEYENGRRNVIWSDGTWFTDNLKKPVLVLGKQNENGQAVVDTSKELYAFYKIKFNDRFFRGDEVVRLKINYSGDKAEYFIGDRLVSDNTFNGLTYSFGVDRFREELSQKELILRVKAFEKMPDIYFEDFVDISDCTIPQVKKTSLAMEYVEKLEF